MNYPRPPSHRTFTFGSVIIDSDFDSGNCSHASKNSLTNYDIWIGADHPKNNYRGWFHFSIEGLSKGTTLTFNIKNMQNQSKLLLQGLVPVYRENSSTEWKRIREKVDISAIEYDEGWIQWSFRHTITSNEKVYLAFYYPWSNEDNHLFLNSVEEKCKENPMIYFYRSTIIKTIEGRPVEFLVISSTTQMLNKEEHIKDKDLFRKTRKPEAFGSGKKAIVIGARVHPGEIPGSHVMTGIIDELTSDSEFAVLLRNTFVFYIFPIFNPDGVSRGHYRVDTNGINLNRCYLNPSAKDHPSIYAARSIIMHLHNQQRFFAFVDLHAHASRKGTFIYGNFTHELQKQVDACLFPKILSMNSADFEYEGSNFTEKNMHCKDKSDHISKEGSGRVAIFRATKNANCWTLQCNYNMSRVRNILQSRKKAEEEPIKTTEENLNSKIIIDYRNPPQKQAHDYFTIKTFHKLGRQLCQSFLDLVEKNPYSRIQNPSSHYKSIQNLRMNLAVALMRMDSTRFEAHFKKIYHIMTNQENPDLIERSMRALYYTLIRNYKIENIVAYIKEGDMKLVITNEKKSLAKNIRLRPIIYCEKSSKNTKKSLNINLFQTNGESISPVHLDEEHLIQISIDTEAQKQPPTIEESRMSNLLLDKLKTFDKHASCTKTSIKVQEFKMMGFTHSRNLTGKKFQKHLTGKDKMKLRMNDMPILSMASKKTSLGLLKPSNIKVIRKGTRERYTE